MAGLWDILNNLEENALFLKQQVEAKQPLKAYEEATIKQADADIQDVTSDVLRRKQTGE